MQPLPCHKKTHRFFRFCVRVCGHLRRVLGHDPVVHGLNLALVLRAGELILDEVVPRNHPVRKAGAMVECIETKGEQVVCVDHQLAHPVLLIHVRSLEGFLRAQSRTGKQ